MNPSEYKLENLETPETVDVTTADTPNPNGRRSPTSSNRQRAIIVAAIIVLLIIAGIFFAIRSAPKQSTATKTTVVINTQTLSTGTLQKLEQQQTGTTVTQQLVITPSTQFKSDVAVQGETSVAKSLQVGDSLAVKNNATVGGNLSVSGAITGTSLGVGSAVIQTLRIGGDLTFAGHVVPSGATPTGTPSVAASNGTVTVNGTDTSGTVTITTGGGQQAAGEMAIITFHTAFATNPRVQLTPVNAASAALQAYVSQSPKFFSVETASTPNPAISYVFNYYLTQ